MDIRCFFQEVIEYFFEKKTLCPSSLPRLLVAEGSGPGGRPVTAKLVLGLITGIWFYLHNVHKKQTDAIREIIHMLVVYVYTQLNITMFRWFYHNGFERSQPTKCNLLISILCNLSSVSHKLPI